MENEEFIERIRGKIERLTERSIDLRIDHEEAFQLNVDLETEPPRVELGFNVYDYPGFARMGIEYAVASIKAQRNLEELEFNLLLARN